MMETESRFAHICLSNAMHGGIGQNINHLGRPGRVQCPIFDVRSPAQVRKSFEWP